MDGPAEFGEFFLNVGQCIGQCAAPMRAGGALRENAFALEYEILTLPLALGLVRMGDGFVLTGCCGLFLWSFYGFCFQSM